MKWKVTTGGVDPILEFPQRYAEMFSLQLRTGEILPRLTLSISPLLTRSPRLQEKYFMEQTKHLRQKSGLKLFCRATNNSVSTKTNAPTGIGEK